MYVNKNQGKLLKLFLFTILLIINNIVYAEVGNFSIWNAETSLNNDIYLLNASLDYRLGDEPIKALHNGVALTLVLDINIIRKRWKIWNEDVTKIQQHYKIKYNSLTRQYLLKYINTGIQEAFPDLNSVLHKIGRLFDLPLLDKHLVKNDREYSVKLLSYLDIEALPAALRTIAYFSLDWRLTSDYYTCQLAQ
jgi:hypothetical protein